jgi:predicted transcriptional regulator
MSQRKIVGTIQVVMFEDGGVITRAQVSGRVQANAMCMTALQDILISLEERDAKARKGELIEPAPPDFKIP